VTAVAVVVPNHNGDGIVGRCVAAAVAAGAAEVVVADDASSDDSAVEAAAAGARVVAANGRGFAAAVNTGAQATSAPYVLLLNSDCFVEPTTLTTLAAALDDDPQVALCGARLVNADGTPAKSFGRLVTLGNALSSALGRSAPAPQPALHGVQHVPFVPLACALVRRSDWETVGGLDERYRFYFEDYDFSWELGRRGRKIAVCWEARALHVGGASSSAREPQRWFVQYHESRARYLRKRYPRGSLVYATLWPVLAAGHAARRFVRRDPDSRR